MIDSVYCLKCRKQIAADSKFCGLCGAEQRLPSQSSMPLAPQTPVPPTQIGFSPGNVKLPDDLTVHLTLGSGTVVRVQQVLLFDEKALATAASMRAEGMKKMGGWSTGLGFIGSLETVVASSLILGAIEHSISEKQAREGVGMVKEADRIFNEVRRLGCFFPVNQVSNIDLALPSMWRASSWTNTFIHNGEPFVCVRAANGPVINVIWDKVEVYQMESVTTDLFIPPTDWGPSSRVEPVATRYDVL